MSLKFNLGDRVTVSARHPHLNGNGTIVLSQIAYDIMHVVAYDVGQIDGVFVLTEDLIITFNETLLLNNGINKRISLDLNKFIGRYAGWFEEELLLPLEPIKNKIIREPDGAFCSNCNNFSAYAEPGFTCWSCRSDPYRCKY